MITLDKLDIQADIKKIISDQSFLKKIGLLIRDIIYRRVKNGYGVDNDSRELPRQVRLEPLSPYYKAWRAGKPYYYVNKKGERVKTYPPIHSAGEFYAHGRSNLTLSGQMLNAISYRVQNNVIKVYINDSNRRPVTKYDKSNKSNREIAEYVSIRRPFFAVTDSEQRILTKEISNQVKNRLLLLYSGRG